MKNLKKKFLDGFTLVEILIVVVIVGILAAIAIPAYFSYVEKAYATDAKTAIKNITQAAEMYRNEEGDYPSDCIDEMTAAGHLDLKQSTMNKWEFDCAWPDDSGEGGTIVATSTADMSGGENKEVKYDMTTSRYTGYGQKDQE